MSELQFATGQGMRACISRMEEFERDCCICGYHVYKEIWPAAMGEELKCDREPENWCDPYAVAVKRSWVVIGHLPRKLLRVMFAVLKSRRCDIMYGNWRVQGLRRSTPRWSGNYLLLVVQAQTERSTKAKEMTIQSKLTFSTTVSYHIMHYSHYIMLNISIVRAPIRNGPEHACMYIIHGGVRKIPFKSYIVPLFVCVILLICSGIQHS